MLYFLIIVIIVLFGVIVYLSYQFNRDIVSYRLKIKVLEDFVYQISNEQHIQTDKLALSEALRQKMRDVNSVLNKDIFELNYELFAALSKKK